MSNITGHVKNALITTGIVLLTIYVAKRVPVLSNVVSTALD